MKVTVAGDERVLDIRPERLVIAGFTGRDEAAVRAHVEELAAIGVPVPDDVPTFYELDADLLSTDDTAPVSGPMTSGEVEPVLLRHDGRYYLGVGSDHTDRDLEREDIARSKAACGKPIAASVVELPTDLDSFDWDAVELTCRVDDTVYQRGTTAALRTPADLLRRLVAARGSSEGDLVMFCGTLPLLGGAFVAGDQWQLSLAIPAGATLRHTYRAEQGVS